MTTQALTSAELNDIRCASCGAAGAMHLHGACHPGGGVDAAYLDGVLTIVCHVCRTPVIQVAVSAEVPTVVCIRHPDHGNEFVTFGQVKVHDVDYGRSNLADPDEYAEWSRSWEPEVAQLRAQGADKVADCIIEAVRNGEGVR